MSVLLNRRIVRAVARDVGESAYLRVMLDDWDWLKITAGIEVPMVTNGQEGTYRVTQAIRCPGGEPEAWVWLRRIGPLPNDHPPAVEVRTSFPMPHGDEVHGQFHVMNPSGGKSWQ